MALHYCFSPFKSHLFRHVIFDIHACEWYYTRMKEVYLHRRSVRHLLSNMKARNEAESRSIPMVELKRIVREQLQREQPELSDNEIERRVERRMEHGMRPCSTGLPREISPAPALTAAQSERKAVKHRMRSRRRSR